MALGSEFGIAFLKLGNEIGLALRGLGSLTGRSLAKYPLLTNLVDSVLGYTGTLTRSTVKTYYTDSGAIASAAINAAAFTGSGVLLEPADTNVMLYANNCTNAAWGKTNLTTTTVDVVGSDGTTTTAGTLTNTATGAGVCELAQGVTITNNAIVIFKLIVKKGSGDWFIFNVWNSALTSVAGYFFNLTTGAAGTYNLAGAGMSATASSKSLGNGFLELKLTVQCSGTTAKAYGYIVNADGSYAQTTGKTMIYESFTAQYEDTSPIITSGVALTRTVDELTVPTTNWLTNEFTLYAEWTPKAAIIASSINNIYRNDYGGIDYTAIYYVEATGLLTLVTIYGGVNRTATISLTPVVGTKYKITTSFSTAGIVFAVNSSSTTASYQPGIIHATNSYLGTNGVSGINGTISNFKYINGVVTATQAEAL